MKQTVSKIFENRKLINSKSFESLSPVYKDAVKDFLKVIDEQQGNFIEKFEGAVEKVALHHNINKQKLYDYFDKETNEQLGV